jgi:hypothetical protein
MQRLAAICGQRANDLRSVRRALCGLPVATDATLGDALGAYRTFFDAWCDELVVEASALDELSRKFTDTANHYQAQDAHWSHRFQPMVPAPGLGTGNPARPGAAVPLVR